MSKKSFTKAAGIMVFAVFLSRVLGLVREAVIAAQFGQGAITDVYKAAFKLPDLLYFMVAGGALSSAFVPVFTEYLTKGQEDDAWRIYSTIASLMALVIGVLIVLAMIYARALVPVLAAPGFTAEQWDQTATLTRIVLPAQFFFFIGGLTMGTLYARREFIVPAMGPIIYNLGIIAGGIFLTKRLGVAGLSWGALAGAFLGNFALQIWYSARLGIKYHWTLDCHHPGVRRVFLLMLPVILGLSLPQVDVLINSWFATLLRQPGALSALDNANRLMQVPLGIFGQAAGIAALPALSALAAQKDWKEFRETVSFGVRSVFFATIPAGAFMMVLAHPTIALVLQGGQFTAHNTDQAAVALVYYCLGVFAWGGQAIIARGFYALQDTVTPVVVGTVMTLFFIPLNWLLMKPLGHGGLALATSVMAIAHMLVLSRILAKRVEGIGAWRIIHSTARICVASAAAAGAAWVTAQVASAWIPTGNTLSVKASAAMQLLPGMVAFTLVYLVFCRLLHIEEAATFALMLRERLLRGRKRAASNVS